MKGIWTQRINEANIYACTLHEGQRRKEANVPYNAHLTNVAMMIALLALLGIYLTEDQIEDLIIAAYLHDTLEDTGEKPEILAWKFGPNVLRLVQAVTEPPKTLPWEERKKQMIARIEKADFDVKILSCADKLDNLQSVCRALRAEGFREGQNSSKAKVWASFNRGYKKQKWYYQEITKAIFANVPIRQLPPIFGTLMRLVEQTFGEKVIDNQAARDRVKRLI